MIPNIRPKGNPKGSITLEALALPAIVILVGLAAFGLGRLSMQESQKPVMVVHQESEGTTSAVSTVY